MMRSLGTATRLAGLLAMTAGAAGMLTACGTDFGGAAPVKTVTVTARPGGAGTSSSAPDTPAAVDTTSPTPAGPAPCLSADLQASLGTSQGTAGTIYQTIVFTNTSSAACTLYGFPGVSFVTGQGGKAIGAPAVRNHVLSDQLVTLRPGGHANSLVGVEDVGALPASCRPGQANWLQIYAPGDTGALYVQLSARVCTSTRWTFITVTAVRPGAASSL